MLKKKKILSANGMLTKSGKILSTCVLRPVHIYGPGDALAISAVKLSASGYVPYWTAGNTSFIYIDNAAFGHYLAYEKMKLHKDSKLIAGQIFYLKDDFQTKYLDASYIFAKRKNPNVKKLHIPYFIIVIIGFIFTCIYYLLNKIGINPTEYKFSYWHVRMLTCEENVSNEKSLTDLNYYQIKSSAEGLQETFEWIDKL